MIFIFTNNYYFERKKIVRDNSPFFLGGGVLYTFFSYPKCRFKWAMTNSLSFMSTDIELNNFAYPIFLASKKKLQKMFLCQSIHNFYDNNTHTQKRMYRLCYNLCISKMYCLGNKMTQIDLNFTKLGRWYIVILF